MLAQRRGIIIDHGDEPTEHGEAWFAIQRDGIVTVVEEDRAGARVLMRKVCGEPCAMAPEAALDIFGRTLIH